MTEIRAALPSNNISTTTSRLPIHETQQQTFLPKTTTEFGLNISAEAQYLFEIDQYLSGLDKEARAKALEYLTHSNDPLQQKAVNYFREAQANLDKIFNGNKTLVIDYDDSSNQSNLLTDGVVPDTPVKGIIFANLFPTFRFDGKENLNPVEGRGSNDALQRQLEALTPNINESLEEQDATTLTRIMGTMLRNAEKALISLDDVIHFTYEIEATRKAIEFYNIPQELKSALTEMVDKTLVYQDKKQSQFLTDSIPFFDHPEAGSIVKENFRMGSAAQTYHNQLIDILKKVNLSVLNAAAPITKLLTQNTDLIKFNPDKINEALSFYQKDFDNFKKILNKDFNPPESKTEIDKSMLDIGSTYALKVIEQIQQYVSNT